MSRRVRAGLPVRVIYRGRTLGEGEVANVSVEGAFVILPNPSELPVNSGLVLSLLPVLDSAEELLQASSMVIHRNREGVGVMFGSDSDRSHRFVKEVLATRQDAPREVAELVHNTRKDLPQKLGAGLSVPGAGRYLE